MGNETFDGDGPMSGLKTNKRAGLLRISKHVYYSNSQRFLYIYIYHYGSVQGIKLDLIAFPMLTSSVTLGWPQVDLMFQSRRIEYSSLYLTIRLRARVFYEQIVNEAQPS